MRDRRIYVKSILLTMALLIVQSVSAAPVYYTFNGFINYVSGSHELAAQYEVGDPIGYTIFLDFDGVGTYTISSGLTLTLNDYDAGQYTIDYVYAELYSGTVSSRPQQSSVIEWNYGQENIYDDGREFGFIGVKNILRIENNIGLSKWTVGTQVTGTDAEWSPTLVSSLTLTSISSEPPVVVPLPGAALLFLSGLFAMISFNRKRSR